MEIVASCNLLELKKYFSVCKFNWVRRKLNSAAHAIAKPAVRLKSYFWF